MAQCNDSTEEVRGARRFPVFPSCKGERYKVQSLLAVASKHGKGSFHGAAEEKAGKPVHERELIVDLQTRSMTQARSHSICRGPLPLGPLASHRATSLPTARYSAVWVYYETSRGSVPVWLPFGVARSE